MYVMVWVCIAINFIGAACFLLSAGSVNQEAAGKSMARAAGILLSIVCLTGYALLFIQWPVAALIISIVPALIMGRIFFRMITKI